MSRQDKSETEIESLRRQIDTLDAQLLELLERRAAVVKKVGGLKDGKRIFRPEREAQILHTVAARKGVLPAASAAAVFREIISACRALEQEIRVAYLGPQGTFSEQAVRQHFGQGVAAEPMATIDEAFRSAESGSTQFAVAPAENSTDGVVGRTLDLLLTTPLKTAAIDQWVHRTRAVAGPQAGQKDLLPCSPGAALAGSTAPAERRARSAVRNAEAAVARRRRECAAIAGEAAAALYSSGAGARIETIRTTPRASWCWGQADAAPSGRPHRW
jgi:chorismate mutase/prephenate dehydratase